ncbi:hypothetical protein [Streptomyces peucetius]|nr:hypothetical protein CGZ69_34770 [Streptomyces peucetius subsp. caesius ATCC 27952]
MNLRRPWKLLTDRLPPELTGLGARIAWIADALRPPARPLDWYTWIPAAAGLRTLHRRTA